MLTTRIVIAVTAIIALSLLAKMDKDSDQRRAAADTFEVSE